MVAEVAVATRGAEERRVVAEVAVAVDDHKRLMDTAAMRESFRCFFLHLAVELGVHPVALQVIAPHIIATCIPTFTHTPCPSLLFPYSTCVASDAQRCRN